MRYTSQVVAIPAMTRFVPVVLHVKRRVVGAQSALVTGPNRVPYELPAHKTRTVFKSMSTPGKEGEPRGFNELRIEDKKGEEEIYTRAEKDVNIHVKNGWMEHILRDAHATTDRHTNTLVKGETHETLTKARKTELHANDNLTVHADKHVAVDGKWLGKAGVEIHLKSGVKIVMEAGAELTLKAGGSWLTLSPAGVSADGARVGLNSGGSAGKGTGAEPELPKGSLHHVIEGRLYTARCAGLPDT